jgi:DNA-binding transcriptional regulator GbsR (MarR family)
MDGVESIHDLRDRTGLSTSCVQGHVRRLTGLGLVQWTCKRGDPILPLVEFVTNVWDVLEDEPNDSCAVESTQLD